MPALNFQKAAAHFELSIDGVEILSAPSLMWIEAGSGGIAPTRDNKTIGLTAPVKPGAAKAQPEGRSLLAHELTHVVQQSAGAKKVSIRIKASHPRTPNLARLRSVRGPRHTLKAVDHNGRTMGGFTAIPVEAKEDAQQQEWSIVYEGIQRVL